MSNVKYAIVGSGTMGQEHIKNINLIDNAEVVAICDNHEKSINQSKKLFKNKVNIFENHIDLIQAGIADSYILATPNFTHFNILRDLLNTNAHLLVEKPLCTTVDDCKKFKKLAKNYPGIIWTAMEYRYMPPVARLIEEVNKGSIGDLKMLSIREHRFPFLVKVNDWNRFSRNTGGTMVEKCCHFFDLMRLISKSEAISVFASGGQDQITLKKIIMGRNQTLLIMHLWLLILRMELGANLDLCMFAENSYFQEEICGIGDKGKIETFVPSDSSGKNSSELSIGLRGEDKIHSETVVVDKDILNAGSHHGSTFYEHKKFIEAIQKNSEAEVSLDDGLKAVAIGQAAELSIIEKRVVLLSELL